MKNLRSIQNNAKDQIINNSDLQTIKGGQGDPPPFGENRGGFIGDPPPFGGRSSRVGDPPPFGGR